MPDIVTLTFNPALDVSTGCAEVRPTIKLRCTAPRVDPGGGGINVARVIHALGSDVLAVAPLGGTTGQRLGELMAKSGTPFRSLPIAGETRESFCVDDHSRGAQYRFVLPGPTLSLTEQHACQSWLEALEPPPRFVVVSGSLPQGIAPGYLAELGTWCRTVGARLVLDVPGDALRDAGRCGAFLAKPNFEELEALAGMPIKTPRDEEAVAHRLVKDGVAEIVLVSLGARGALAVSAAEAFRVAAPAVTLCSAVGAGDSMVAGVVHALGRGMPLAAAVRFGVAAGSAALATPGTGLAPPDLIHRLYRGLYAAGASRRGGSPVVAVKLPALSVPDDAERAPG